MSRKVFVAYPRLDVSFDVGPVPAVEGMPSVPLRYKWRDFLDGLIDYHRRRDDVVSVEKRALWQFDLNYLKEVAARNDIVYVAHRQKHDFDVGPTGLYFKISAFLNFFTVDRQGWGPSMSWCPVQPVYSVAAERIYADLKTALRDNTSKYTQPPLERKVSIDDYDLFVCQMPNDTTISYHSKIGVLEALQAVLSYCEANDRALVVKGHPADPSQMGEMKKMTDANSSAIWVDDVSIHACLAGATRVYLVNSGSGFEAILHNKPIIAFGNTEYAAVVAKATTDSASIRAAQSHRITREQCVGLIGEYINRCVDVRDPTSYERVERAYAEMRG